jgi:hypothetical protein
MRPTSTRLREIVKSTHTARGRVTLIKPTGTGYYVHSQSLAPAGDRLTVLDGDVRMDSGAVIRSTIDVTVQAAWGVILPNGAELFAEYGVEVAGGQFEWVALGYFRVETVDETEPGVVRVTGSDRMAQAADTETIYPWVAPANVSHGDFLQALLFGQDPVTWFHRNAGVFTWYSTDQAIVTDYAADTVALGVQVPLDKPFSEHLVEFGTRVGKRLFFDYRGRLNVVADSVSPAATPVRTVRAGPGGGVRNIRRQVTREGVYTSTSTKAETPTEGATPIGWRTWGELRYPDQMYFPPGLRWYDAFGRVVRKYSSPLLTTSAALDAAAWTWLQKCQGLPYTLSFSMPADPTLEPLDTVAVQLPIQPRGMAYPPPPVLNDGTSTTERHVIDTLSFPLTGGDMHVTTRGALMNALTGEVLT